MGVLGGLLSVLGILVFALGKPATAQQGAAVIAGVFGLVGVTMAGIQGYLGYIERRGQATRETVFRELNRFAGGRQQRNIGISIVGHYWTQLPDLQGMFVRLLTNQAIYLLAHGDLDQAHEFSNVNRIIDLLEKAKENPDYRTFYDEVIQELTKRRQAPSSRATADVLDQWNARLALRSHEDPRD